MLVAGQINDKLNALPNKTPTLSNNFVSLVPRPAPSFPSLAVRLSGRGPGTFPHVSDVTDRANYANVGVM